MCLNKFWFLLLTLLFFTGLHAAEAKNLINITEPEFSYNIGSEVFIFEDKDGAYDIETISLPDSRELFKKSEMKIPNYGFTDSIYWFSFSLKNNTTNSVESFLEIGYSHIDILDIYVKRNDTVTEHKLGDLKAFSERLVPHYNFIVPIQLKEDETVTIYISANTQGHMLIPLNIYSKTNLMKETNLQISLLWMFYGMLIVMVFYNLFLFLALKDRTYLYYVLYIAGYCLFQVAQNGFAYQYFWPSSIWLANHFADVALSFAAFWGVQFSRSFLQTKENLPGIDKVFIGMMILFSLIFVTSAFVSHSFSVRIIAVTIFVFLILMLPVSIYCYKAGYRPARFYIIAWSAGIIGGVLFIFQLFAIFPSNFITVYGIQFGTVLEVILLSFALADRINLIKNEKNRAQIELVKNLKRADKIKDEILANTSHELRTPLNGIIGVAESLIDGFAGRMNEEAKKNLLMVVASAKRLANLVNDILDFSSLKTNELRLVKMPVNIKDLAELVVMLSRPLLKGKQVKIKNAISNHVPYIYGDENRLQQILFNLVNNAIKYTEKGLIEISAKKIGNKVEITVSDTGIGIDQNKYDDIFVSFEQIDASVSRKKGGTGLGLSITRQLVEMHGGTIWVFSRPGSGSKFTFSIPVSHEQPEVDPSMNYKNIDFNMSNGTGDFVDQQKDSRPIVKQGTTRNQEFNILVVDDEPINIQVITNQLSIHNYSVIKAEDGEQALKIFENGIRPDLVLLDVMMPNISGYDVCRKIRETYSQSELPVIMITAKNQVGDLVQGLEVGANDYILKPFSKNELIARVKMHLQLAQTNITYSRFVPQAFIEQMGVDELHNVKPGDNIEKNLTVMFVDISSISQAQEGSEKGETFRVLNSYLNKIGSIIKDHDGFIENYIGFGIMALFPDKTESAVTCAIKIQKQIIVHNEKRVKSAQKPVKVGIGIHTSHMMIGTVGNGEQMQSAVLADTVHIASHIEELTRFLNTSIIITDSTLSMLKKRDAYTSRTLGKIRLKNHKECIQIYDLYEGDNEQQLSGKNRVAKEYEKAMELFFKKDFMGAASLFAKVLQQFPEDTISNLFYQKALDYRDSGVPKDWEGVELTYGWNYFR